LIDHKVPHIFQGGLVSDQNETWEFSNPNFRRDRPDLLVNVKRKNYRQMASEKKTGEGTVTTTVNNVNQVTDLRSVLTELHSIKRTQADIASELQNLRMENTLLWQESAAQRQQHEQQKDILNKVHIILVCVVDVQLIHFVATVFQSDKVKVLMGSAAGTASPLPSSKRPRLLLNDDATPVATLSEIIHDPDVPPTLAVTKSSTTPLLDCTLVFCTWHSWSAVMDLMQQNGLEVPSPAAASLNPSPAPFDSTTWSDRTLIDCSHEFDATHKRACSTATRPTLSQRKCIKFGHEIKRDFEKPGRRTVHNRFVDEFPGIDAGTFGYSQH
jgi:hypothetical protein